MIYVKKNSPDIIIQTQVGFRQTLANFGQPMSDDQLLFAAL